MAKFRLDEARQETEKSVLRKSIIIISRTSLAKKRNKILFVAKPGRGNFALTLYTKKEKKKKNRRKMRMIDVRV